jgi:hypothetical protein
VGGQGIQFWIGHDFIVANLVDRGRRIFPGLTLLGTGFPVLFCEEDLLSFLPGIPKTYSVRRRQVKKEVTGENIQKKRIIVTLFKHVPVKKNIYLNLTLGA